MDASTGAPADLRPELSHLTRRITTLESVVLRTAASAVIALLLSGLVTPYLAQHKGTSHSILGLLFAADTRPSGGADLFLYGAFVLLAVVVVICAASLTVVWGRRASRRAATVLSVLLVVVALGTLGAWAVLGVSLGATENEFRPAVLLLTAGVLGYGLLVHGARRWWSPDPV